QIGRHFPCTTHFRSAPLYPGTCRHMSNAERIERLERGDAVQFRLDIEAALERTGKLTFSAIGPTIFDRPQIRYARPELRGDVVRSEEHTSQLQSREN